MDPHGRSCYETIGTQPDTREGNRHQRGAVEAQVTLDVNGQALVAVITMDAVRDLGLAVGSHAIAVIKADHIIVGIE